MVSLILQAQEIPFPFADASHSSAGLGFDSRAKECKVVRLLHTEQLMQCEVYTIGASGRAWRPAARGIPFPFIRSVYSAVEHAETTKMPPVFANGCLHWLLGPRHIVDRPGEAILSFCVADETFGWVRAPSFVAAGEHLVQLGGDDFTEEDFQVVWIDELVFVAPPMHLVELDGCLCLVQDLRRHSPEGSTMEIWVLHDYSSGVWSLHSRIDMTGNAARDLLEPRVARVLGSTSNGSPGTGKIVIGTCHQTVHAYDPTSDTIETVLSIDQGTGAGELRRIKTKRNPEEASPIQFSLYEESFAPMHRAREEVALSSPRAKAEKEILLRLPAGSITRFKLVCKHWRALIESESFIHLHLVFANTDKEPKIMLVSKGSGSSWFNFHAAPPRGAELNTKVVCSKPCHGLNLVSTEAEDYLCNSCTGFQMALLNYSGSQFLSDEQPIDDHRPDNAFSVGDKHIGLGLNLLTQRHVVVKLAYWMQGSQMRLECWYWDGVTLKWNKSDELPPLPVNSMPPAYLDGVLYWMSEPRWQQQGRRWAIVSFDIAAANFGVIPCPSSFPEWCRESSRNAFAIELAGMLCCVLADPATEQMDVWKLDRNEWERAYSICLETWPDYSLRTRVVVPQAVDPRDGRILLNTGRELGLYDTNQQLIETLYLSGSGATASRRKASRWEPAVLPHVPLLCHESLVRNAIVPPNRFSR